MKKQISKQKYFDKSKTAVLRLGAKVTYDIYDKPISFYLCVYTHPYVLQVEISFSSTSWENNIAVIQ